jgi:hypothetical protein
LLFLQPLDACGINNTEFLAMSNINLRNIPTFELLTAVFLMIWVFWDVTLCRAIDS